MPHTNGSIVNYNTNTAQYACICRTNVLGLPDGYVIKCFDGPLYSYPNKRAIIGDDDDWTNVNPNITGTIGITSGTTQINGTNTQFTSQVSPGDKLIIHSTQVVVDTVPDNTTITLTEAYTGHNLSGENMWKI